MRVASRFLLQNNLALWSLTPQKKLKGRAATLTPLFLQSKIRSVICIKAPVFWHKAPVTYIIARRVLYQSSRGMAQSSRGLYHCSPCSISKFPWHNTELPWFISLIPVCFVLIILQNVSVATCRGLDQRSPWYGSKIPVA